MPSADRSRLQAEDRLRALQGDITLAQRVRPERLVDPTPLAVEARHVAAALLRGRRAAQALRLTEAGKDLLDTILNVHLRFLSAFIPLGLRRTAVAGFHLDRGYIESLGAARTKSRHIELYSGACIA